jgi:hypothetical protein
MALKRTHAALLLIFVSLLELVLLGETEVDEKHLVLLVIGHDVLGLEVAMHDAGLVHALENADELVSDPRHLLEVVARVLEPVLQGDR